MSQTWSYMGCFLYCQCYIPNMVLHGSSYIVAHVMSQTWSYGRPLISMPTVPDMVLYGTSLNLNNANAMCQTWSYMVFHSPNVMTYVSDTFLMFQRDFFN
ncbi:hypothetical protein Gotur_021937, partial [Gossypium turneri]